MGMLLRKLDKLITWVSSVLVLSAWICTCTILNLLFQTLGQWSIILREYVNLYAGSWNRMIHSKQPVERALPAFVWFTAIGSLLSNHSSNQRVRSLVSRGDIFIVHHFSLVKDAWARKPAWLHVYRKFS